METISYILRKNAEKIGYYTVIKTDKLAGLTDQTGQSKSKSKKHHELTVVMEMKDRPVQYIVDEDWEDVYEQVKEVVERAVSLGMFAKVNMISQVYGNKIYGNTADTVPSSDDDIIYIRSSDDEDDDDDEY